MRNRHNKKRNTAFLYEALTKEITKSVMDKAEEKALRIKDFIKEHFKKGTELYQDLMLYRSLSTEVESKDLAPVIVREAVEKRQKINKKSLFNQQTRLIEKINKTFGQSVFSNFVTNYKHLATIYQMFHEENISKRIVLESKVGESLMKEAEPLKVEPLDRLVFKKFVENFKKEQKELIEKYVFSFSDNGIMVKTYLNEEISRLKNKLAECKEIQEVTENAEMMNGVENVLRIVEDFKNHPVSDKMILKVLEIQELISEALDNGN